MQPKTPVFQQAKAIIAGANKTSQEFQLLADYIQKSWGVSLIHGDVYNYVQMSSPIRLRLIFMSTDEILPLPAFWKERQRQIGNAFKDILTSLNLNRYADLDLSDLQIDYFVFEKIAFEEGVSKIDTNAIKTAFPEQPIWMIDRFFDYLTVFFHSNKQLSEASEKGIFESIQAKVQEFARAEDPFGIMRKREVMVRFDSKENFDRAGGSYNYYR